MININATFTGNFKDLDMFLNCGILHNSIKKFTNMNTLIVTWICEESNYNTALETCMDLVNMRELELWNCNLQHIA